MDGRRKHRLVALLPKRPLFDAQRHFDGGQGHLHAKGGALKPLCGLSEGVQQGKTLHKGLGFNANFEGRAALPRFKFLERDGRLALCVGDGFATRGELAPVVAVRQRHVGGGLAVEQRRHDHVAAESVAHVQRDGRVGARQLKFGHTIVEQAHQFEGDRSLRSVCRHVNQRLVQKGAKHVQPTHCGIHNLLHLHKATCGTGRFKVLHRKGQRGLSFGLLNACVLGLAQLVVHHHLGFRGVRVHQGEAFQILVGGAFR